MSVQSRKSRPGRISIGKNPEIVELARKQGISLDSEAVLHMVEFGMKNPHSESQLSQRVSELEEKKKILASEFRKIALQRSTLASRFVGLGTQIGRVYRDNRVLIFHLCARTPSKDRERRMRDKLIKKYLWDLKPS